MNVGDFLPFYDCNGKQIFEMMGVNNLPGGWLYTTTHHIHIFRTALNFFGQARNVKSIIRRPYQ